MGGYSIICKNGHYEAWYGNMFVCSGDTFKEAADGLEEFLAEMENT